MLGCDYSLLWVSLLPPAILAIASLLRLLLTRWASLIPPEHEQPSELQLLLQELAPPPAACAGKAEGEAEEAEEEAGEAEEAEVVGRVASAEVLAGAAAGDAAGSEGGCSHGRASVPAVKTVTDEGEEDEAALHSRITSLFEQLLVVH